MANNQLEAIRSTALRCCVGAEMGVHAYLGSYWLHDAALQQPLCSDEFGCEDGMQPSGGMLLQRRVHQDPTGMDDGLYSGGLTFHSGCGWRAHRMLADDCIQAGTMQWIAAGQPLRSALRKAQRRWFSLQLAVGNDVEGGREGETHVLTSMGPATASAASQAASACAATSHRTTVTAPPPQHRDCISWAPQRPLLEASTTRTAPSPWSHAATCRPRPPRPPVISTVPILLTLAETSCATGAAAC